MRAELGGTADVVVTGGQSQIMAPLLAQHFVREVGARLGRGEPGIGRDAEDLLRGHSWPGNIRELENAIERALILADGSLLTRDHFDLRTMRDGRVLVADAPQGETPTPETLADLEKRAIVSALEHAKGNKTHAAAMLGITRTQLRTRLARFGIASADR